MRLDFAGLSLQDALDLAVLIEKEAEERYLQFAEMLGKRYTGDASDVFRDMARNESRHGRELALRRQKLFKNRPSRVDASMISDVEAPDYGSPRSYMGPRQAAGVAYDCEVKAFEFFDQALKAVEDPEVRRLFEELRGEEKHHMDLMSRYMISLPVDGGPDRTDDELDEPPAL